MLVPRPVLSNRRRVNCAASGMNFLPMASDSARRASLGALFFFFKFGLLKGPDGFQAGAVCPLRGVALDIVDLRQRVTI